MIYHLNIVAAPAGEAVIVLVSGVAQLVRGKPVKEATGGAVINIQLDPAKVVSDEHPQALVTITLGQ